MRRVAVGRKGRSCNDERQVRVVQSLPADALMTDAVAGRILFVMIRRIPVIYRSPAKLAW